MITVSEKAKERILSLRKEEGRSENENIRVFTGLGVRFIHKTIFNAILRLDYGFNVQDFNHHGLVFGIGQYF